jgi:Protein of unknown function (DUF3052)
MSTMANIGYSGTPLPKKLGIKAGHRVVILNEPAELRADLEPLPDDVEFADSLDSAADVVMLFFIERAALESAVAEAERLIFPNGAIWIAWPKKASKVPTDITEDVLREIVLPRGLVDNKVCAINNVWSGLRVVWRVEHRK